MVSHNLGRTSSVLVRNYISVFILLINFLFIVLPGCKTSKMSVQEAVDIAVQFQGTYKTVPPRGLGATIERKVEYYKDPPNVPAEYLKPQKKYSDSDLEALSKGFTNYQSRGVDEATFYSNLAYDEFLRGNISLAIRLADLASGKAEWQFTKAHAFACKAIFLATAGDYKSAELALSMASRSLGSYSRHPRYMLARIYLTKARAAIYSARGDLITAEKEYLRLIATIEHFSQSGLTGESSFHKPEARVNLARVLISQGRLTEAQIYVREAIRFDHINIQPYCFITLSRIFLEQGRFEDARICARTALHIAMSLRAPLDAYIRANARNIYARTLFATGRYGASLEQYYQIEKDLETDRETFERRFKGNAEWGLTLLINGFTEDAIKKFEFATRQEKEFLGANEYTLAELGALRAMALVQSGQTDTALKAFHLHVPQLLEHQQAKNIAGSSHNAIAIKLKLILEAYMAILAETGSPADNEKSFLLANTMQGRLIGRAVAMSSARSAVKDPELAKLIRQRQDLEMKLTAFKNQLANSLYAPPELINTEVVIELRIQVSRLNQAVNALEKNIRVRFPGYANIINPPNFSAVDVQKILDAQESLISIFSGRDSTFIWAVPKQGPVALSKVPIGKSKMAGIIYKLRKALNPGEIFGILEISAYELDLAYSLYKQTLKPVETGWKEAKHLMVIAQGPIGQIPLSILPTTPKFKTEADQGQQPFSNYRDVDWLIKTHSVTVLPSVSALVNLRSIRPNSTKRVAYAGFGDPYFNQDQLAEAKKETKQTQVFLGMRNAPIQMRGIRVTEAGALDKKKIASIDISMLNRLPDTREEVINIATTLNADMRKDVFIGQQANEKTVKSLDLSNRKVLVFATHGLIPGDLDGLDQPALALSAPDVTGHENEDGLLTMGEIMGLHLNADWVVLSACNTGAAEGEGAEAVSGLGQAFFYAGARSLLVTGWPVETVSAKLLTTNLFQRQLKDPEINRAEALRLTMNAMIAKNHNQGFSYAHPIFWAPFTIVGDGRR